MVDTSKMNDDVGKKLDKKKRQCASCGDTTQSKNGVDCGDSSHFLCSSCFSGFAKSQFDSLETFKQRNCHILCDYCLLNEGVEQPLRERKFVALLGEKAYDEYFSAKARVAERAVAERIERETRERIEYELKAANTKDGRVLVHKKEIEGTILTTQCPGCKGTILDFDACFAVTCEQTSHGGCGSKFCAFCLAICPNDAHDHVANCLDNPKRGQKDAVFCEGAEFHWRNKQRMQTRLLHYLKTRVASIDLSAVIEAIKSVVISSGLDLPVVGFSGETAAREEAENQRANLRTKAMAHSNNQKFEDNKSRESPPSRPQLPLPPLSRPASLQPNGKLKLLGHSNSVRALAVLPDGRLASGSNDNTIRIWGLNSPHGAVLSDSDDLTLRGHTDSVRALTVLSDAHIVSGSDDCHMRVWTISPSGVSCDAVIDHDSKAVTALVSLSHQQHLQQQLKTNRVATGSKDGMIRLWTIGIRGSGRAASRDLIFAAHDDEVTALSMFPDLRRIASASSDGTMRIWTIAGVAKGGRPKCEVAWGDVSNWKSPVLALAVLPDCRVVSGSPDSRDKAICVWVFSDGEASCQFRLEGHFGLVRGIIVLSHGNIASCSFGEVRIWSLTDQIPSCQGFKQIKSGWTLATVYALAVLPDGRIACGADDNKVRVSWLRQNRSSPSTCALQ